MTQPPADGSRELLHSRFAALCSAAPHDAALIDGATGAVTTKQQLMDRAGQVASLFREHGIGPADFVALQLPNSADFPAVILAASIRGAVVVPIDRDASEWEVANVVRSFPVRAVVSRSSSGGLDVTSRDPGPRPLAPDALLIKLTSGSSGRPKGVVTSAANLVADCMNICTSMDIRPDDVNLGAIPFSHSYGFSNLITPLLLQGTAIVISNDYLPLSVVELCNRHRCTVVPAIPMVYDHLAQLDPADGLFESVRTFISAGAPLSADVSRRFRARFGLPIHSFYGCSETGGITFDVSGSSVENGHVGRPLTGVDVVLSDADGRLVVRGRSVAAGYLNASDQERHRFTQAGEFVTDDLGRWNGDGTLTLIGRIGDLINTAGKKVNPREVEAVLLEIDGIRDAKVYGEPAGARGDVVAAVIVSDREVSREEIRRFCRERLSPHKVPRIIKQTAEIPVDARGKVKLSALATL